MGLLNTFLVLGIEVRVRSKASDASMVRATLRAVCDHVMRMRGESCPGVTLTCAVLSARQLKEDQPTIDYRLVKDVAKEETVMFVSLCRV